MRASSASMHRSETHVGATTSGSILSGMAILGAIGLGGATLLVTAKPIYAGIATIAGLFIGASLHSESAGKGA